MSWIRRAFETLHVHAQPSNRAVLETAVGETNPNLTMAPDLSYFMDDSDLLAVDEDFVDPYEWPPAQMTVLLSEAYFHAMQGIFPFILRQPFLQTMFSSSAKIHAKSK